jgi:hypothetical protein
MNIISLDYFDEYEKLISKSEKDEVVIEKIKENMKLWNP